MAPSVFKLYCQSVTSVVQMELTTDLFFPLHNLPHSPYLVSLALQSSGAYLKLIAFSMAQNSIATLA